MRPSSPRRVYAMLRAHYGPAGWWPGESAFEVCLGAILTQNTAWPNVEKALAALRARGLLAFEPLRRLHGARLAALLRSSGTYRVKARRVRAFLDFVAREYDGRVEAMRREETVVLRAKLLGVNGIGPETADSIALYAAQKPLFVVDAYARRIFGRLGLPTGEGSYDDVQRWVMRRLPREVALLNDYHAQLVRLGKDHCRVRPRCGGCPLDRVCPRRGV